jgi:hypothetical protein
MDPNAPAPPSTKPTRGAQKHRIRTIAIVAIVVSAVLGAGVYFGWHVEITTGYLVDYQNATGSWPMNMTPFVVSVSGCGTFSGFAYAQITCKFYVLNPMNISQNFEGWGIGFGWTVAGSIGQQVTLSNAVRLSNGFVQLNPHNGTIAIVETFAAPSYGGNFHNTVIISMEGTPPPPVI